MAGDYIQTYDELLDEALSLSGSLKINLLEQAMRLADANHDVQRGYDARMEIVEAAEWSGQLVRSLVVFPWMLAQHDKDPNIDSYLHLLWMYKWAASALAEAPEIQWDRIEGIWGDLGKRLSGLNYSLRPVHKIRAVAYAQMGRLEEAREHADKWQAAKTDRMSDCRACDLSVGGAIRYLIGDYEKGLEVVAPVLKNRTRCTHEPHRTRAWALFPLLATGQVEEAVKVHKKNYPQICDDQAFLEHCGEHILFLTLTGNLNWAAHLFARHYSWVHQVRSPRAEYLFLRASKFFLEEGRKNTLDGDDLRRICNAVANASTGKSKPESVDDILKVIEKPLTEVATKYDQRNGTTWFADRMKIGEEITSCAVKHRIKGSAHLRLQM